MSGRTSICSALAAAVLFGASTPFAKRLVGDIHPMLLAGLLYVGSGIGLWSIRLVRDRGMAAPGLSGREWSYLLGAIATGGVVGPLLLMIGLSHTSAAGASLLLNLESVLTAILAWVVFRESADRRIVLGMMFIVAGGLLLAWPTGEESVHGSAMGSFAVAGACLCWAVDNNLTRKVSAFDAVFIAGTKGLVAGATNLALALAVGARLPAWPRVAEAMGLGLAGYGVSLILFVLALRDLGSARTGAYFAAAPFIGAFIAIVGFHEPISAAFLLAVVLMGIGVWLHLTERHAHEHTHEVMAHSHRHVHDEHHCHEHDFPWDAKAPQPHTHLHRHEPMTHVHHHFPDVHHRHSH